MTDPQLPLNIPTTGVDNVEEYRFEPIKGYPMLNWKGKRPFTNTRYYPAQLKERYGEPVEGWLNQIFWGDNLQVMSHLLKEYRGKVNLVYIDPPFDSKADYKKKISLKGQQITNDQNTFEEKQYTDIWTNDEYLQFMYERLILIRELLADDGTFLLHCDYHKSHLLRLILDEIFGMNNFRNEIIVKRPITKNLQLQFDSIQSYSCGHDNIYVYSKSIATNYKPTFTEYESSKPFGYWHHFWNNADRPTMRYEILGIKPEKGQWKWSQERALKAIKNYENFKKSITNIESKSDQEINQLLSDYWNQNDKILEFIRLSKSGKIENWFPPKTQKLENTLWLNYKVYENVKDYPTQKHTDILSKIISTYSRSGDTVFDCFMGGGTTQAVAMKLGRRFIGADINLGAVQTTTKRLLKIAGELNQQLQQQSLDVEGEEIKTYYTGFEVYNVNHYEVFRNPIQAKELLTEALEIHKLDQSNLFDGEKDGRMYKIMPVNRISTRTDLNELIAGFDYKAFDRRKAEHPNKPVEHITLVCMGHEPDLAAQLKTEVLPYQLDVEVVDILRDRQDLQFKRDSEAKITVQGKYLAIEKFYPMNLLAKLSLQKEKVEDWRELVESIMIDWNYDGAVLEPAVTDIPGKNELVSGTYKIPDDAGTIRVKITDLLSESLEQEVNHG
jgi:DNA modification methylase